MEALNLYRFEARPKFSSGGESPEMEISLLEFVVLSKTPYGYWLRTPEGAKGKKWVGKTSRRPYAYEDKKRALESFIARKQKYSDILASRLRGTISVLEMVTNPAFSESSCYIYSP